MLATLTAGATAGCGGRSFGSSRRRTPVTRTSGRFPVSQPPAAWSLPNHDAAHTRTAPAAAAPETLGTLRWSRERPNDAGAVSGLVATADRVVLASRRRFAESNRPFTLTALAADSGRRAWRVTRPDWTSTFSADHGPLPVQYGPWTLIGHSPSGADADRVAAFAAGDGSHQWSVPARWPTARIPLPAAGLVHARGPNGGVRAHDPVSGRVVWSRTFDGLVAEGPAATGDTLYYPLAGTGDDTHAVAVLDARTGEKRRALRGEVQSYPVVADGRLFTAAWGSGRLAAIDVTGGDAGWRRPAPVQFDDPSEPDRVVNARYVFGGVTDDRLVVLQHFHGVRSDRLWGLDPATGERRWRVAPPVTQPVTTLFRPVVAGDRCFVTGFQHREDEESDDDSGSDGDTGNEEPTGLVWAYDTDDGSLLGQRRLPVRPVAPPVVADGSAVIACTDRVIALG